MNKTLEKMKGLAPKLTDLRRRLHENPEIGYDLPRTTKLVTELLEEAGYKPQKVGKAGITAVVGQQDGKTILLRADMDALPMREETGLSFASLNGSMHACGHDIHTTALLGAALVLKEREKELKGQVKLIFQPAEECMTGAADMVKGGILQNPKPDAALALHVVHGKTGTAGYAKGNVCGSSDVFRITVSGKGGHGAAPHLNVDPIHAACHIAIALEGINSREVHPAEMLVLTICMLNSGTAPNIMPEKAVLEGTIRTMNPEVRSFAKKRLVEIAEGVAASFRASCQVDFQGEGIPPMQNDISLTEEMGQYIDDMLGSGTAYEMEPMTGSEDFSVISREVPSALFWVGTGSEEEGYPYGVHDPRVTFSEEAIPIMAAIYAETAMKWLENHNADQNQRETANHCSKEFCEN